MSSGRPLAGLAALLTLLAAAGCDRRPESPPDVLLVSVERLPWQELSLDGGPVASPRLEALASGGWRFEQLVSSSPDAGPAALTLLSGLTPFEHGLRRPDGTSKSLRVSTLADELSAEGWRTGAFSNASVLPAGVEIDRAFEAWMVPHDLPSVPRWAGGAAAPARPAAASCQHWLRRLPITKPAFAWLHLALDESGDELARARALSELDSLLGLLAEQVAERGRRRGVRPLVVVTALAGADDEPGRLESFLLDESAVRTQAIVSGGPARDGARIESLGGLDELHDLIAAVADESLAPVLEQRARGGAPAREAVLAQSLLPMDALGAMPQLRAVRARGAATPQPDPLVVQARAADPVWPGSFRGPEPSELSADWRALEAAVKALAAGRFAEAESGLAALAAARGPEARGLQRLLGLSQLAASEPAAAVRTLAACAEGLPPADPARRQALLALAEAEKAAGSLEAARELLAELLEARPNDVDVLLQLGALAQDAGDGPAALATLGRALDADPGDARVLAAVARVHLARGRPDLASEAFGEALKKRPVDGALLFEGADAALAAGDYWTALDRLQAQKEVFGESAESDFRSGLVYAAEDRCLSSTWFLSQALEKDPAHHRARVALAQAMLRCGEETGGRALLAEARTLRPDSPLPCRVLAGWLADERREDELGEVLAECRAAHPGDPVLAGRAGS